MKPITHVTKALDRVADINIRMVISDLFALGLYLRKNGLLQEGYKVCSQALDALPIDQSVKSEILKDLDSDHYEIAVNFKPHIEVLHLLETQPGTHGI